MDLNPLSLLKPIVNSVTTLWGNRQRNKDAVGQRQFELASSKESHNHTWELAALAGEGWELPLIRVLGYLEITIPVVWAVIDPLTGVIIWNSLALVPGWVIGLKVTIFGWAFGSTPIKSAAAGLVGSVIKFPKKDPIPPQV